MLGENAQDAKIERPQCEPSAANRRATAKSIDAKITGNKQRADVAPYRKNVPNELRRVAQIAILVDMGDDVLRAGQPMSNAVGERHRNDRLRESVGAGRMHRVGTGAPELNRVDNC